MPGNPPGWTESAKFKTPVQHTDGKIDGPDIGRPKPVTYRRGGSVKNAANPVPAAKPLQGPPPAPSRPSAAAPAEIPKVSQPAPADKPLGKYPLHVGSKSGVGRLQKAKAAMGHRGHAVI
jgi:hypothetical protein